MSPANDALRRARERVPSSRLPGCPLSRDELAGRVNRWLRAETGREFGLDERAIGRWERGVVRTPSAHYRAALRAVLQVEHDRDLGFAEGPSAPTDDGEVPSVSAIRALASAVHVADRRYGGGGLYGSVLDYLRGDVARALFSPDAGADVFAATASLTEIAGWMAHDSGRDLDARAHFTGSYRLALAAGSPALAANMCASMSHLAVQLGTAADAARLADAGLERAAEAGGIARVAARLHAMRAKSAALQGDHDGCLTSLRLAESALGGDDDHEHAAWSAHFDVGSLAAETATALHLLGDLGEAERHAETVIALRDGDRVRARAFGQLSLAMILLDAGRTEEAAALGRAVCVVAPSLSSARVRSRLGELAMDVRSRAGSDATRTFLADVDVIDSGAPAAAQDPWPV